MPQPHGTSRVNVCSAVTTLCSLPPVLAELHGGRRLLVESVAVCLDGVDEVREDVLLHHRQRAEVLHQDLGSDRADRAGTERRRGKTRDVRAGR